MASVTGDVHLAIREIRVYVRRDAQHVTRHTLLRVIIAGEIALDVTEGALNAERGSKRAHSLLDIHIRREYLQVLRRARWWASLLTAASAPLGQQAD
jgi:hypothetical protein